MTTLLTRQQVDTLRSIGDSALVLMALWIIDLNYPGRASKASEIAMYIRKDARTVEKQLNELCATNRVVNTSAGYVLLEGGRALVLEMTHKDLALSPENNAQALPFEAQALETPVISAPADLHTMCALKKEEEEEVINFKNNDSPSSESKSGETAQNAPFRKITTQNLIDESDILFAEGQRLVLSGLDLDMISPTYVLGAFAHACAESHHLRNPAGLVYNMLKSESRHSADFKPIHPRKAYLSAPWMYLPKEFAEKFGMAVYDCPFGAECGGIVFSTRAEYEAHMETVHKFIMDEEPAPLEVDPHGMAIWQKVLDALKPEMPKASFETWVKSAVGARFEDGKLIVISHNSYARDWLDSRMASTIEQLAGMTVEFVA